MSGIRAKSATRDVDGVIAISFSKRNCEKIYQLIKKPIISIDAYGEAEPGEKNHVVNIGLDDESGGYKMTKYLLDCGYEHIKVCAGRDNGVDHLRYVGAQKAMEDYSTEKQKLQFVALGMNEEKRMENYEWLMQRRQPKTALFFLSDIYALEAISCFVDKEIQIPQEIGIAGYDDISYSKISNPRLTTVRQDVNEKAKLAVDLLLRQIEGGEIEEKDIHLPVTLMKRRSVRKQ